MSKKFVIELKDEPSITEDGVNYYKCVSVPWWLISDNIIKRLTPYDPEEKADCWSDGYFDGFDDGKKQAKVQAELDVCHDIEAVARGNYQKGLDDAWEVARKIVAFDGLGVDGLMDCFGDNTFRNGILNYSASEAIDKIREYEKKKKAEAEIEIGDEIKGSEGDIYVVVGIDDSNGTLDILNASGVDFGIDPQKFKKTGQHFPEIVNVLKAMKGG